MNSRTPTIRKKFTLEVDVDVPQLTAAYLSALELQKPDSLLCMLEHEFHWLNQSGIFLKTISEIHYLMTTLNRITFHPEVMGGKPCIRGMRVTVGTIVGLMASGHSPEAILKAYPYLEIDDIYQSLAYAALLTQEIEVPLASS